MNVSAMIKAKIENSLSSRINHLIKQDYSMIAGQKIRKMFTSDIIQLIDENYKKSDKLEVGQIMWIGVDENERPSYGKNASNTRFQPVILTPISKEDIQMMSNGHSQREVREKKIVRMFKEAKEQGALLTNGDVGLLLGVSPTTVSKQAREYMERENEVLPTRGIVHDIGRAITHKRIIILLYLKGHLTPEISRKTNHSETAVERYIKAFKKVRMLRDKLDLKNLCSTLEMSEYLAKEYLKILEDWERGDIIE